MARIEVTQEILTVVVTLHGGEAIGEGQSSVPFVQDLAAALEAVYREHGHNVHQVRFLMCEQFTVQAVPLGRDM